MDVPTIIDVIDFSLIKLHKILSLVNMTLII
jgi:hypothetical protein